MEEINSKIAKLSPGKRALLEEKLRQKIAKSKETIKRRDNLSLTPLSFAQMRMWLLDRLEPGNPAYNRPSNIRLTGELNVTALEQSLNEIIRRHEVLRAKFPNINGQPVQIIEQSLTLQLPVVDLSHLLKEKQQNKIKTLAIEEAQQSFNLAQCPLIRVILIRLKQQEHILLLTFHHIIFDGWSMGIFLKELATLYEAFYQNQASNLSELSIQYADFARWQQQHFQAQGFASQLDYWKDKLKGELPILELPTDRKRSPVQTFRGAKYSLILSQNITKSLKALSQQEEVTLFMTLLAAFKVLLYRYTYQKDLIIGSPIAGRSRLEIENSIGVFINTLVFRNIIDENVSFREFLAQVRQVALEAYAHQDLPFEILVQELQPERDLSHNAIFQVLFQLRNLPKNITQAQGLKLEDCQFDRGMAALDLSLDIIDTSFGLNCRFEYNTDLFDRITIERMARHYQTLLESIISNCDRPIWKLPILIEAEQHQLLIEWNQTQADYPQDKCIHQLFEEQVERTPDAVAVVFEDEKLTYRELNQRANQLAHYLKKIGIDAHSRVGIYLERSLEVVVGLLAVLKAGGTYIPLDPDYPNARLASMVADAQISLLLTSEFLITKLPENCAQFILLNLEAQKIAQESPTNLCCQISPSNLAYIIYTSGSIGTPKGVTIAHQSLVNAYWGWRKAYHLEKTKAHLQMANFSFDVFTGDLVRALCSGAKLVLCPRDVLLAPEQLYQLMQIEAIDCAEFVPVALRSLQEYLVQTEQNLSFMSLLIVGSDSWYIQEYLQLYKLCGQQTRLINSYGVSEATIDSCYFESKEINLSVESFVPIGKPFNNIQLYILDEKQQPVPIGVPGELHIGGVGLAKGYLNQPKLNQAKFINNPFSNNPQARLYKTGDSARYLSDGNIEFLGRKDNQVKIRGFRIELAEIESVMSQHPTLGQTVVILREDIPGDKRLVAYSVAHERPPTIAQLREFLSRKLPQYMIPSAFIYLEFLPLTPNGKIDRRSLAQLNLEFKRETEIISPCTPTEEIVTGIWSNILKVNVNSNDNFFELGGHSLLATQVISRLRDAFGIELSLRNLFEKPTVAQLSSFIESKGKQQINLPAIQPLSRPQNLPLSFAQARLWLIQQWEKTSAVYNIPKIIRIEGNFNLDALEKALSTLCERHETLRTIFPMIEGEPVQVIINQINVSMTVIELPNLTDNQQREQIQEIVQKELQTPFDLATSPLWRVKILGFHKTLHVLVIIIHHIISDGWSMGILTQELSSLYQAFLTETSVTLAPLPIQYADFTLWQYQWLTGDVLETQLTYWKEQLADIPPVLELPTDRPRPTIQTFSGSSQLFQLSKELTQQLKKISQEQGVTLFMTLLSAFGVLLYRYTHQEDILIGSPVANRNRREIESLIGCFVNTLVLRIDLRENPTFIQLLKRVRQITLDAYAHQDLPFEKLVEELQLERHLSHHPLFQVMLVLQNASDTELTLPEASITLLEVARVTAKFDLTLVVKEIQTELQCRLEYNTDLFDAATINRLIGHFETLLTAIVTSPETRVAQLPILTSTEQQQLLVEWNQTQTDYPQDKCIHQLFEEQVARTPDAIAVVFEDQKLTYRELNNKSNQLAHYLQKWGVLPENLVGICLERSPLLIIGILAILKAGGTYVPLDTTLPQNRLSTILKDAQISLLLTQESILEKYSFNSTEVVFLESQWQQIESENLENLNLNLSAQNLAYLMYTSGSTGIPKGVAIPHYAINRLIFNTNYIQLNEQDNIAQVSNPAFDAATFEIWGALLQGAKLTIIERNTLLSPFLFSQCLQKHHISVLFLTTALFNQFSSLCPEIFKSLKYLLFGGESVNPKWVKAVLEQGCPEQLIHVYGPTENTTFSTFYLVKKVSDEAITIPIGRPISNTQVYLLDEYLQPVPIGVRGEIYLGGDGLAQGYFNRFELTNSQFISNALTNNKLYKTGDLARYLPDGNLVFLGRVDCQVKIRGFRIELGEIETVLAQHPSVDSAVVISQQDSSSHHQYLVAYVCFQPEKQTSIEELKNFLIEKLPSYMLPSVWSILPDFTITLNGKVDRRALPPISLNPQVLSISNDSPKDEIEQQLQQIWQNILGKSSICRNDNFFEIGGSSIIAVRLLYQLKNVFNKELSLDLIFQNTTIEQLGNILRQNLDISSKKYLVIIQPNGNKPPLFAIHTHLSAYQNLVPYLGQEQPIYGLADSNTIEQEILYQTSVENLAINYIQEMQLIQPAGPYYLIGGSFGGMVALEIAQQLLKQGETVAWLGLLDTVAPNFCKQVQFQKRLVNHWQEILELGLLNYLEKKFQARISLTQKKWKTFFLNFKLQQQKDKKLEIAEILDDEVFLEITRRLNRRYIPQPYPGRICLFRATKTLKRINRSSRYLDEQMGWGELALGGLDMYDVPGTHLDILLEPYVQELATQIQNSFHSSQYLN